MTLRLVVGVCKSRAGLITMARATCDTVIRNLYTMESLTSETENARSTTGMTVLSKRRARTSANRRREPVGPDDARHLQVSRASTNATNGVNVVSYFLQAL